MITNNGEALVKRHLAGLSGKFAQTIGIGIGNTAPAATDTRLVFETERYNIGVSYITSSDKIIFKATVPENIQCDIQEVGLFSYSTNPASGEFSGQNIALFNQSEGWSSIAGDVNAAYTTSNSRFGGQTILQSEGSEFFLTRPFNFSGYSTSDLFLLAGHLDAVTTPVSVTTYAVASNVVTLTVASHTFAVGDNVLVAGTITGVNGVRTITSTTSTTIVFNVTGVSNTSGSGGTVLPHCQAHIVFHTPNKSILYTNDLGSADGYIIKEFDKADNAAYVDFDWGAIESINIYFTGRGGRFYWDALRVLDNDMNNQDMVMIGRIVPASPIVKNAGIPLELQYEMDVSVSGN